MNRLHGVMGWFGSTNSKFFIKFLHYLSQSVQNQLGQENNKYVIVCDNTRIHTSREVERFIVKDELRLMTIAPYSPSLNPVEKVICAIKMKLKSMTLNSQREICLRLVKQWLDEVSKWKLTGFIRASSKETLYKMEQYLNN